MKFSKASRRMNQSKTNTYSADEGRVLVVDKPVDWTSFDVVNKIRRLSGIKKVGHAGTLDPFATGILLICLGKATKRFSELLELEKEYEAEITLGSETDTMDHTGTVIVEKEIPTFTSEDVEATFDGLVGEIQQEIPSYSAAKFKGKRLYKLARAGKEVPTLYKSVSVYSLELLDITPQAIRIRVACGRGTYIRTLARDIARKLGTAGHLTVLTRTRVGSFKLEEAQSIQEVQEEFTGSKAGDA